MSPSINQYVISLDVSLPSRRGASVFMNDSVQERRAVNKEIFDMAKFTIPTPLSLLS